MTEETVNQVQGAVPVMVGTGSNNTEEATKLTLQAQKDGADAALLVSPYYNKPPSKGLVNHFEQVAKAAPDIPKIIYNLEARTGQNIDTETLLRIIDTHESYIGVKEASGNLPQMMEVIARTRDDFLVLSGDDKLTLPLMAIGGDGVISVLSNVFPNEVKAMVDAAKSGDFDEARRMHYKLLDLMSVMFIETNPGPVKTALAIRGDIEEVFRSPMWTMEPANREKLFKALQKFGGI